MHCRNKIRVFFFFFLFESAICGKNERLLLKKLFVENQYNNVERPVENESDAIEVSVHFTLRHIINFNEETSELTTGGYLSLRWNDTYLTWNPEEFGNISTIRIPASNIWIPDIVLFNNFDDDWDGKVQGNAVVSNTGHIVYVPRRVYKTPCTQNEGDNLGTYTCSLIFGSWSYDKNGIKITSTDSIDNQLIQKNQKWTVKEAHVLAKENVYACCPEVYPDVEFTYQIAERASI